MEIVKLKVSVLEPNTGQIEGLPKNPRQWRKEDIDSLARSLKETPELFEARPLLVYPLGGKYVILGGNMRFVAARANKAKEVPVVVFPADTPIGKLKELVLKDNGSFGTWDYDELANSWDDLPLIDWGVPSWEGHADIAQGAEAAGEGKKGEEDDFDEDEDAIQVRCKPGDVWILGDHRLVCGDSVDLEVVKKAMGGGKG